MPTVRDVLAGLRGRVPEVDTDALAREGAAGAVVLDVRERDEWDAGHVPGAVHLPRGTLDMRIEGLVPDRQARILLYCGAGNRSLLATEALGRLGYANAASVSGGFARWRSEGRPVQVPEAQGASAGGRYARHLSLPEVGEAGQERLRRARVMLVGAGGLGSPAALYLAAAGVGRITLVDDDVVDESNLQRQVLHDTSRVGLRKVDSGRATLRALNPDVRVDAVPERLTAANVDALLPGHDVVLDGADNFPTRYLLNDACVKHGIPDVHGSVFRFEGQCTVLWPGRGPCYRCLFPAPPPPEMSANCAEAGVLGVLPGVVGTLQAVEALKILLGAGQPLVGRLLVYDALQASFTELALRRNPDCPLCAPGRPFPGYEEMARACAGG